MNPKEAAAHAKAGTKPPWDEPTLVFCPGRYYWGMFYFSFSRMEGIPHGGNWQGVLWREDEEPTTWRINMRMRYNAEANNDPFDNKDKKSWYLFSHQGTQEEAVAKIKQAVEATRLEAEILSGKSPQLDWLIFEGDCVKAMKLLMESKKPWLHFKMEKIKL